MPQFVGAVDCGTTSCRFFVFDQYANVIAHYQHEYTQHYPQPGWHEQDPEDWISSIDLCIDQTVVQLKALGYEPSDIHTVGFTNQRETTVVWDKTSGRILHRAIAWPDVRTTSLVHNLSAKASIFGTGVDQLRAKTGLPISNYFAALKLRWLTDHSEAVRVALEAETLMVGTVDTYLLWHYTGGVESGMYVTDVTNASRTMLMDVKTLEWCPDLLNFFGFPSPQKLLNRLPQIVSNAERFGTFAHSHPALEGIPISGLVGDQQGSLVGNLCLSLGESKNTYGTGCFMLYNTGKEPVWSHRGLITTPGYQLGQNARPMYALEGSVAVGGSSVQWVKNNLGLIQTAAEIGELAGQVEDTGGVYFVTAFSGLFAPYWDDSATGLIVGLTHYTTKQHLARATLEATCFQTKAILDAMDSDQQATAMGISPQHSPTSSTVSLSSSTSSQESRILGTPTASIVCLPTTRPSRPTSPLKILKVDGGMTACDVMMQLQADLLGVSVERPEMRETTALGAALLAGHALGLFGWDLSRPETVREVNKSGRKIFLPRTNKAERERRYRGWNRAVTKSKGWFEDNDEEEEEEEAEATAASGPGMTLKAGLNSNKQTESLLQHLVPETLSNQLQTVTL
ncbi:hypothetical protein CROQUDRAFT_136866 [Cronartium quercuum f. sp. fusiforme G11]|uniref:glycerol kinase n=1 Tax=Cronartium quercuum f. sp. fusiforme G11 TaxID=708437 RepID=A0A9P6N9V7_9BASI|nr:hypothetical protein CROQUDRAFT_136866 [Cronartium quercuum f. sp. fusiforme G11]